MSYSPSIPVELQIRKIIFEKFNQPDLKFTNDEIFEILKNTGDIDPAWIIDDTEKYFLDLCDSGLARNIAQNFTTIWMKLFESSEKFHCSSCNNDVFLGPEEDRICPNSNCKSTIS